MVVTSLLLMAVGVLLLLIYIRDVTRWDNPPPSPDIHPFFGSFPALARLDPVSYRAFGILTMPVSLTET